VDCSTPSIACHLDRIADSLSEFDWNAFIATLVATIIGALVAAFIGLAVARMERPQPFFRAEADLNNADWSLDEGVATVPVEVCNIGDGPAYNVDVSSVGGIRPTAVRRTAKLDPGDSLRTAVVVRASGALTWNGAQLQHTDTREVAWPDVAGVKVQWQQPPRRHRRRQQRLTVREPA
jgi:hypothetical protein